jgi:D-alanyl-D-alanine carboxypeptidase
MFNKTLRNWPMTAVQLIGWSAITATLWTAAIGAESLPPPTLTARAAVLMNPDNGQLLYAFNPHLRLPPASTTKILTGLIALERLDLYRKLPVSLGAAETEPSRLGLHAGENLYAHDLLYGLLLKSGNDAAEILAETIGSSVAGFANIMNARAFRIGARNSHFVNPHGLPNDQHYSSAYDLALIFRHAMNNPLFAEIVRTHTAELRVESPPGLQPAAWRLVAVHNTNRLLASYEGAMGGKTGFTRAARNCFVGEASRQGIHLIVAVLGSAGRPAIWQDVTALLDYGFAHYGLAVWPSVITAGSTTRPVGSAADMAEVGGD